MNGIQFLFEFQSRNSAEHTLMGEWWSQGVKLKLDWWSLTKGALPEDTRFNWFRVRVLGLPLQLWSKEVMKMIGKVCGGLLENEEETELKNHLRWACIRVRGPKEKIPSLIEVSDGGLICKLSVWVEAPVAYRRKEVDDSPCRDVTIAAETERANVVVLGRLNLSIYGKGKDMTKGEFALKVMTIRS
ncbi:hypothetical protein H5410_050115 [Solanum commersonii]|uniref:DUF4283 domain-containing protein n=1 Tax=Solanum commersonii TaxID=4109 RepID=A0A9J5WWX8_SOLCO|nr:hypothetical protein H5410_050115 [Solanum commersonii]